MNNPNTWQVYALLTGVVTCSLISVGAIFWCQEIGGCSFGRYRGTILLTNKKSLEPIKYQDVEVYTDYSSSMVIPNRDRNVVTTDTDGQVEVKFSKDSKHPLAIGTFLEEEETGRTFVIQPEYIRVNRTISQEEIESFPLGGTREDIIKLELQINSWFFF